LLYLRNVASVVNLVRRRPSSVHHIERPPLFIRLRASRTAQRRAVRLQQLRLAKHLCSHKFGLTVTDIFHYDNY